MTADLMSLIKKGDKPMTTDTSGPAFPTALVRINGVSETEGIEAYGPGMTLRDYFAAKAMQSSLQEVTHYDQIGPCARDAYRMADAMLEARK